MGLSEGCQRIEHIGDMSGLNTDPPREPDAAELAEFNSSCAGAKYRHRGGNLAHAWQNYTEAQQVAHLVSSYNRASLYVLKWVTHLHPNLQMFPFLLLLQAPAHAARVAAILGVDRQDVEVRVYYHLGLHAVAGLLDESSF